MLKNILKEKENESIGNLPIYKKDLKTSVAFQVLTNHMVVVWFLISTTTIWFVKTWNATEVLRSFLYMGRFPMDSFSFSLRIFFSTIIPITFITTIPSEVLLGISPAWKIFLEVLVSMTFLIFSRGFWKFALKFYTLLQVNEI